MPVGLPFAHDHLTRIMVESEGGQTDNPIEKDCPSAFQRDLSLSGRKADSRVRLSGGQRPPSLG